MKINERAIAAPGRRVSCRARRHHDSSDLPPSIFADQLTSNGPTKIKNPAHLAPYLGIVNFNANCVESGSLGG